MKEVIIIYIAYCFYIVYCSTAIIMFCLGLHVGKNTKSPAELCGIICGIVLAIGIFNYYMSL